MVRPRQSVAYTVISAQKEVSRNVSARMRYSMLIFEIRVRKRRALVR